MRIGTRLLLSLLAPLVAILLVYGYLDARRSEVQLREELSQEGSAVARVLQHAVESALRDHDVEDLALLSDRLADQEPVVGIRVFDASRAILHESKRLQDEPFGLEEELGKVLATGQPFEVHQQLGDLPVLSFLIPLTGPQGGRFGALEFVQLDSFAEEDARAARRSVIILTFLMIVATGSVVLIVTRICVGVPVEALVRSFQEVGAREVPTRVTRQGAAEFGRLADAFNGMCERLEASQRSLVAEQEQRRRVEERLQQEARLAGLGRLAAGLAHEIGTPLNVIRGRAESLGKKLRDRGIPVRGLRIIIEQIDRIGRTVRNMLDFARQKPPRRGATGIDRLVRIVLELLAVRFEESGVRVDVSLPSDLPPVSVDADQMQQVFLNLAQNAVDAMPEGGRLKVEGGTVQSAEEGTFVAVAFIDTGTGIAPEDRARVFDPFFTTKEVGRGSGLGLSVSYSIVREHGGWIEVDSAAQRGCRMTVCLPAAKGSALPARVKRRDGMEVA